MRDGAVVQLRVPEGHELVLRKRAVPIEVSDGPAVRVALDEWRVQLAHRHAARHEVPERQVGAEPLVVASASALLVLRGRTRLRLLSLLLLLLCCSHLLQQCGTLLLRLDGVIQQSESLSGEFLPAD